MRPSPGLSIPDNRKVIPDTQREVMAGVAATKHLTLAGERGMSRVQTAFSFSLLPRSDMEASRWQLDSPS